MTSAEWAKAAWAACVCAIIAARSATSLIMTTRASRPGVTPTVTIAGKRSPFFRQSTTSYSPRPTRETSSLAACNSATDSSGQYGSGREHPAARFRRTRSTRTFRVDPRDATVRCEDDETVLQRVDDQLGDLQVPVQVPPYARARPARACERAGPPQPGGRRRHPRGRRP